MLCETLEEMLLCSIDYQASINNDTNENNYKSCLFKEKFEGPNKKHLNWTEIYQRHQGRPL